MIPYPASDTLAEGVLACKPFLVRYLAGFTDGLVTAQATNLPNHVAWSLGHLGLTMHRVADKLDAKGVPESDFVAGTKGDAARFGIESVAFGSTPVADASNYPGLDRCIAIYEAGCNRLAATVHALDEEGLKKNVPWGESMIPAAAVVHRMIFHNGMHCGQIADLRRALGLKSIFS